MDQKNRFGSATKLRIFLAIMVVMSHAYPLAGRDLDFLSIFNVNFSLGTVAVDGFFALSGYFLYESVIKHSPVEFLVRRFLRLAPLLALSVVLTAICFEIADLFGFAQINQYGLLSFVYTNLDLVNLNRQLQIPGAFPNNPIGSTVNGSLWTLNYEFWASLILLFWWLVVKLAFSRNMIVFILPFIVYPLICVILHFEDQGNLKDFTFRLLPGFFFGCFIAFVENYFRISLSKKSALINFLSVCTIFSLSIVLNFYLWISIIIFPILLLTMRKLFENVNEPRFDTAYGIFLFGYPVTQFLVSVGLTEPISLGVIATLLSAWIAVSCAMLFEKYFNFTALKDSILGEDNQRSKLMKKRKIL